MKTIAQQIKWDFETNGFLKIKNKNDRTIYYENSMGVWEKCEWDSQGNIIYFENSDGDWSKYEMDSQGKLIYFENSRGYWEKCEYDSQGNRIYYENSHGEIVDNRPKPYEGKEIVIDDEKFKLVKL